jgi:calcium-dependent protein kinase
MIHQPTPFDHPVPKLIDFGLSTVLLTGETSTELYGTLAYCSPEIFLGLPYSHPTDIWSMGVVIHMILSGIVPFMSMDKDEMKRNIIYRKVNFNQVGWIKISNDAKDLVVRMLEKDYTRRINID